jgi:alcohol dehydrogenase
VSLRICLQTKHLGAIVATTTGTANLDWVKGLDAETVIDYRRDNLETTLRDYDVVLDTLKNRWGC